MPAFDRSGSSRRVALEVQLEVRIGPRRIAPQQPNRPVLVAQCHEPPGQKRGVVQRRTERIGLRDCLTHQRAGCGLVALTHRDVGQRGPYRTLRPARY